MILNLVTVGQDEAAHRAYEALQQLPNAEVQISICPSSVAEWFECPFVRDEQGQAFFGLDGIEFYVAQRLKQVPS